MQRVPSAGQNAVSLLYEPRSIPSDIQAFQYSLILLRKLLSSRHTKIAPSKKCNILPQNICTESLTVSSRTRGGRMTLCRSYVRQNVGRAPRFQPRSGERSYGAMNGPG